VLFLHHAQARSFFFVERQERAVIFAGSGRAVSGSFVYGVAVFKKQARWLVASGGVGSNDLGTGRLSLGSEQLWGQKNVTGGSKGLVFDQPWRVWYIYMRGARSVCHPAARGKL
jgi:hypothetical protein